MAAENQKGYPKCRYSLRSKGSQPNTGIPSPEQQYQEEEPTKYLAVKISKDSFCLGEADSYWKCRCPLKGLVHRLTLTGTHPGLQQRNSSLGAPEIYREKLSYMASG